MSEKLENKPDDGRNSDLSPVERSEYPPLPEFSDLVYEMDLQTTSVEERFALMYELTIEAYSRIGIDVRNVPMRRDIMRVIRMKEQ